MFCLSCVSQGLWLHGHYKDNPLDLVLFDNGIWQCAHYTNTILGPLVNLNTIENTSMIVSRRKKIFNWLIILASTIQPWFWNLKWQSSSFAIVDIPNLDYQWFPIQSNPTANNPKNCWGVGCAHKRATCLT